VCNESSKEFVLTMTGEKDPKRVKTNNIMVSMGEVISKCEELKSHLRHDWKSNPTSLPRRQNHLCGIKSNRVIGIDEFPTKICRLFDFENERRDRPGMGMVNAGSGSGKSVALQFSEEKINQNTKSPYTALAVTFNRSTEDGDSLEECEGLAMRIAERFFMRQGAFDAFRNWWITVQKGDPNVNVFSVVDGILQLMIEPKGKSGKLLILVDEAGLAGSKHRRLEDLRLGKGWLPECSQRVVDSTSVFRTEKSVAIGVRFLFTTLKPVYNDAELEKQTLSGGQIRWLDLPFFLPDDEMRNYLREELKGLKARMPESEFDRSVDFIITISSGHWSTFNSITDQVKSGFESIVREQDKWLQTVYFENVKDVVVQTRDTSSKTVPATNYHWFQNLVVMAILGIKVRPSENLFPGRDDNSLIRLSFNRVIQNRFKSEEGNPLLVKEVPNLSLLEVREWALDTGSNTCFKRAVHELLCSAGHDPKNGDPRQERLPSGIGFERVTTCFFHAKFLAWILQGVATLPLVDGVKTEDLQCNGFFAGYEVLHSSNTNRPLPFTMSKPSDSRLLYIRGTGGFRGNKIPPAQLKIETDEDFEERQLEWYEQCLAPLRFEQIRNAPNVVNGDIIYPGSKNQLHSDAIFVIELQKPQQEDGKQNKKVPGLVFDQMKFSKEDASTAVSLKDIKAGLDKLVQERGLLFNVPKERLHGVREKWQKEKRHGTSSPSALANQIAALGVKEEDVIYCWSVLRSRPPTDKLKSGIFEHAEKIGFLGTVLISERGDDQAKKQFGDSFCGLALLHRAEKV